MPFSNHNYTRRAENSEYMPTPTIVEAAQALYSNHNVNDITRSDAGARNLTKTTEAIKQIIRFSKENRRKSIVFVTGVPGAGKTLVGLNLASEFHNNAMEEHAIFLSGNLPLVAYAHGNHPFACLHSTSLIILYRISFSKAIR